MLNEEDYQRAADSLGVEKPTIKAVAVVESQGEGFLPTGEVKILFERHVFYQQLKSKLGREKADSVYKSNPDICNPSPGGFGKYSVQHAKLQRAVAIDRECALNSASWGAFQIMGYHWKTCGYESQQEFINAMYSDAGQLSVLVAFLKANPGIVSAMKSHNWTSVARQYNGVAYSKNSYDIKLKNAYLEFSK